MLTMKTDEPLAVAVVKAIHGGDVDALERLLSENQTIATARLGDSFEQCHSGGMSRSLLHVVTDWPGHYPNGAATVAVLVGAGADVNARFAGPHEETPLHWAASSDDVEVLDALLDHGADIEAPGAVIGGGTPLSDAVAFGQWKASRRLVEHGAKTLLWEAAALGLMDRVRNFFADEAPPSAEEVTSAFWCACHGGQRASAEHLFERGADLNWIGYDNLTPLDAARSSGANELADWLFHQGGRSADEVRCPPPR
jgi:ankyrin repeat protein